MVDAPLWVQTTTDTPGHEISDGKGDSKKALLTARRAGLGERSRVVSPDFQSWTRYFPWYHSSVHAKTTTPQQPPLMIVRICQPSTAACLSSQLRWPSSLI